MKRRGVATAAAAAALLWVCAPPAGAQPATGAATDTAERAYLAGNGLLARGLNEAALAEYRAFLDAHPSHAKAPLARYGLGVALLRLGRYADAERELAAVGTDGAFPYAAEVALMLGQCRFAQGDYAGAAAHFERVVTQHKAHALAPDASALLAESRYRAGDHKGAVRAAAGLSERSPDASARGRAELFSGLALLELGDAAGAAAVLRSAASRVDDPALRAHASLGLGRALVAAGKPADAAPVLRELLKSDDAAVRLDAALMLAEVLRAGGELEEARTLLEPAAEAAPAGAARADALMRLARVRLEQGAFDEARGLYARAGREDVARADEAAYWSAKCQLRGDAPADAAETLAEAIRRFPQSGLIAEMKYDRGVALMRAGEDKDAARALREFAAEHPDHALRPEAVRLSAALALRTGDAEGATAAAAQLVEEGGDAEPEALLILAQGHAAADREDEAAAAYRRLLKEHAGHAHAPLAALQLGSMLLAKGEMREGTRLLERAAGAKGGDAARVAGPALLLLGDNALKAERWDEAEGSFRAYLALPGAAALPATTEAALKMGIAQARGGNAAEASRTLDALIATDPGGEVAARALLERGTLELQAGDTGAAQRSFEAAAKADPGAAVKPYAMLGLAGMAERAGDAARAGRIYAEVAGGDAPASVKGEALFLHAQMLAAAGRHDEAAALYDRLLESDDTHTRAAEARARLAIARSRAGDAASALEGLEAALKNDGTLAPDLSASLLYERAWCLQRLERPKEAAAAYRDVMRRAAGSPSAAYAALELGELEAAAGREEQAAAVLKGLLDEPGEADAAVLRRARYRLGAILLRTGKPADGVAMLKAVLSDPGDLGPAVTASAALLCADALIAEGRHDEAASLLRPVAETPPDDAAGEGALLRLADCLAAMQDWRGSETACAAVLERYPDSELWFQARFGLGWARENLGRHDDAMEQYRAVVEKHQGKTAARAQFQIGECLFALSKHAEAAAELLKVDILYAYPEWSAAALYEAGRCFEHTGDLDEARRQYRAVQERFGGTRWAELAGQRLAAAVAPAVPGRR